MDNEDIKAEDLLMDESFQRYCLGLSTADSDYWEAWQAIHPQSETEFLKAKQLFFVLNGRHTAATFKAHSDAFRQRLNDEGILKEETQETKVIEMTSFAGRSKMWLVRYVAAAILIACIATGGFLLFRKGNAKETATHTVVKEGVLADRRPGSNKATLTLGDGTTVVLDSVSNGTISQQGAAKLIKVGDLLTYARSGEQGSGVVYNTISTPKGGQYQLVLNDGTKVWLNAASTLRFPSSFPGVERTVELHGEGYFEVAHNPAKPFHVNVNDVDVEVLGTHFDVMAYHEEGVLKTTLVEGKVRVKKDKSIVMLLPGQQARVYQEGTIQLEKTADLDEALAWKNGLFSFSGADVGTIMRQIGRWYNVETVLKGDMRNIHLSGTPSRNLNLSQVIRVLELSGISIQADGDKIIASPMP